MLQLDLANQTIVATSGNFQTNAYGNYRIGSLAATTSNGAGDLTMGSTANAIISNAAAVSRVAGGSFSVDGSGGSATITYAAADSARTVARLINNQTSTTGVYATARTEFDLTAITTSSSFSMTVQSDKTTAVTISFTTGATANADGSDIRVISFHETHEWDPCLLNDGRVVYTRWDYVDRNAVHYQQLWSARPDGSNVRIYYGNNTWNSTGIWEARAIPGGARRATGVFPAEAALGGRRRWRRSVRSSPGEVAGAVAIAWSPR